MSSDYPPDNNGAFAPLIPGDASFSDIAVSNNARIYNNVGIDGNLYIHGIERSFSTIDSTGLTTGSFIISGGVAIQKQLWVGSNETVLGSLYVQGTTPSTGPTTGSLVVTGGLGVLGQTNLTNLDVSGTTTSTTITDGTFTTTGGVFESSTIIGSSNVVAADYLNTTGLPVQVNTSSQPSTGYVLTATSSTEATWQAVSSGSSYTYAMFYGLTAGTGNGGTTDYAATVPVKTSVGTGRVPFPRLGPAGSNSATNFDGTSAILLPAQGTYKITFNVHTTEPGQLQLELNGLDLADTVAANMNPTSGGHPIGGTFIVTTTQATSIVAVINPDGNSTALTITPANGSETHANTQSLVVEQIA